MWLLSKQTIRTKIRIVYYMIRLLRVFDHMETFFDRANGEVVISMVETTRKRRYMYNILLARPLETIRKRVQARK